MRGRGVWVVMLVGTLLLSTAAPATALLGGLTDPLRDTLSDSLLGPVTDPLLDTVDDVDGVVDDALDAVGAGPLTDPVAEALLSTGELVDDLDDPLGLGWSTYLPAWPDGTHVPSVGEECRTGNVQCVDRVIRTMQRRYEALGCEHAAVFGLTYLLTTQEYRRAVEDPAYFADNAFVNHQDAVFAQVYFDAIDDWRAGDHAEVPPAWRVAFDAGERRVTDTTGDLLLGMNAHIRRDLPFVLEAIGLVAPDGETRKADHDRVNDILAEVQGDITEQVQARHDPGFGLAPLPLDLDEHAIMHAIRLMREEAWRKAELLVAADGPAARERVATVIEHDAAASALAIRILFPEDDADARASHCAGARADG